MKSQLLIWFGVALVGSAVVMAQGQPQAPRQGPGVQATQDSRYPDLIAQCKNPPAARGGGAGAAGRAGGAAAQGAGAGQGRAAAAALPASPADSTVTEIPGVVAAGARWTQIWETDGNNADGIIGTDDGALLIAQNDNSAVVRLDKDGKTSVAYRDTNTGGALSMSSKGALFVAERALNSAIRQLAPQRRLHANRYMGDPLDCLGGVLNDMTADSKGGVYFTMSGLLYADPKGVVTKYGGEGFRTNGLILSRDEKTLYVTNGAAVAAFDVQPDGSLTNQRQFAALPFGNGDGSTIDGEGRVYVTGGAAVHVIAPDGKYLGNIPAPVGLITAAFSGPDKKTLFAVASIRNGDARSARIFSIPMIAQGYKGRAK